MRKAQIFSFGIVIVTLLALTSLAVIIVNKEAASADEYGDFGRIAADVMNSYQKSNDILFDIEVASTYSMYKSLTDMAGNAGLMSTPCGVAGGSALWLKGEQECYPVFKTTYLEFFEGNLYRYLGTDEAKYELRYSPDEKQVIGESKKVKLNIKGYGEQYYTPAFTIQLPFDMKDFSRVLAKTRALVAKCKISDDLDACVKQEMDELTSQGDFYRQNKIRFAYSKVDNRVYSFSAIKDENYIRDDGKLGPLVMGFALEFPPKQEPQTI